MPTELKTTEVAKQVREFFKHYGMTKPSVQSGKGKAQYIAAMMTSDEWEFSPAIRHLALDTVYGKDFKREEDPVAGTVTRDWITLTATNWLKLIHTIGNEGMMFCPYRRKD